MLETIKRRIRKIGQTLSIKYAFRPSVPGMTDLAHQHISLVLLLAAIQPALVAGGQGRALVIHQHGFYGVHLHLVAADDARMAGRSAHFGHSMLGGAVDRLKPVIEHDTVVIPDFIPVQVHDISATLHDSLQTASAIDLATLQGHEFSCRMANGSYCVPTDEPVWLLGEFGSDLPLLI